MLVPVIVVLVLLLATTITAVLRVRKARKYLGSVAFGSAAEAVPAEAAPAGAPPAGAAPAGAVPAGPPVSRLGLLSAIVSALTVFVLQWVIVSLPGWAIAVWVLAALGLLYVTWEAARLGPDLPWLRPAKRAGQVVSALVEGLLALAVLALAVIPFVVAG